MNEIAKAVRNGAKFKLLRSGDGDEIHVYRHGSENLFYDDCPLFMDAGEADSDEVLIAAMTLAASRFNRMNENRSNPADGSEGVRG